MPQNSRFHVPNVRMFIDFTNSSNSFLYHNSWFEIGVRAAYNLLTLPRQIARYKAFSAQVDAEEYRSYAQAIAVMAQVRMVNANLAATRERFEIDNRIYEAYRKNLNKAEASKKISSELSQLELDHMKLATAETEIEKYLALGNYYVSYFRVLNTLGIENLHKTTVEGLKKTLAEERVRAAEELKKAEKEFNAKKSAATEKKAVKKAVKKTDTQKTTPKKNSKSVKNNAPVIPADPYAKPMSK